MKEYQVFVNLRGEIRVRAKSYEEAEKIAKDEGYGLLQYSGEIEIEEIYEVE